MDNVNRANECPLCGTYLPSLGHLLSERDAIKARITDGMNEWPALFAVEAQIVKAGALHLISDVYSE